MIRASSMLSNAIADPANGSLILRGVKVDVNSDVGHQFAIDCTRFVEGLITEAQLRKKYALDDSGWQALADHEELQRAVGARRRSAAAVWSTAATETSHGTEVLYFYEMMQAGTSLDFHGTELT
jgi:hypothetical protein